jgi:hypothetical protein
MADAPKPVSGPNLWAGLDPSDIHEMLREDVAELNRLYARKKQCEALPAWKRSYLLEVEIAAREQAHDNHWTWLRDVEARETWSPSREALG